MKFTLRLIAVIALLLAGPLALAQAWPTKPIRIINPFPAGGGTDTFARPLAAKLTQSLGQTVIIENQGGAGGTVGAANAARTNPDGYTFLMGAIHHTIAESLYPKLSYNIEKDFIPITMVAQVPQVMVVHPKHPFRTVKELVDYAKANPGKLNFGSPGAGTSHHLAMELFMRVTGTSFVHVPYRGAGPMMQDFLAGQIDLVFDGMGTSSTQIKAGKLRGLAIATASGVQLAHNLNCPWYATIILGVITAVTGGLLRDVLCQLEPVLLHRETIATSSLCGSIAFVALIALNVEVSIATISRGVVVALVRALSIQFDLNLPKFKQAQK
jgi:tripartite-type tricarboxylate transporter receptor subunit TctC